MPRIKDVGTGRTGEISPAPENLINRDLRAEAPNEQWLTDITEFQIPAGKVYLSPMIDCFDGLVVSWTLGTRPDSELVNTLLDAAIDTVTDCELRPVVHSDRGGHYGWPGWLKRMSNAKITRSMSRKGCSPDNAACEGFFGRLKTELFSLGTGRTHQSTNSSQRLTPASAGITKNGSRSPSDRSALRSTGRALGLRYKPVQVLRRTPSGSIFSRR